MATPAVIRFVNDSHLVCKFYKLSDSKNYMKIFLNDTL